MLKQLLTHLKYEIEAYRSLRLKHVGNGNVEGISRCNGAIEALQIEQAKVSRWIETAERVRERSNHNEIVLNFGPEHDAAGGTFPLKRWEGLLKIIRWGSPTKHYAEPNNANGWTVINQLTEIADDIARINKEKPTTTIIPSKEHYELRRKAEIRSYGWDRYADDVVCRNERSFARQLEKMTNDAAALNKEKPTLRNISDWRFDIETQAWTKSKGVQHDTTSYSRR